MTILPVSPADAAELLAIYAPYVRDTAISFEYEVPSLSAFRQRIETISARFPYLKAVDAQGHILGYAYASSFKSRKAYDWSVELSIYIRQDKRRAGLGRALYEALEASLRRMGILNLNVCIAVPKVPDVHLNFDSLRFHARMGYALVGTFHNSGYKFDTWYDMVWMEKMIGPHKAPQQPVSFGSWTVD